VEGREAAWEKGGRRDGAATMGRRATDGGCRRHEVSDALTGGSGVLVRERGGGERWATGLNGSEEMVGPRVERWAPWERKKKRGRFER
jgi:hypothetical protein